MAVGHKYYMRGPHPPIVIRKSSISFHRIKLKWTRTEDFIITVRRQAASSEDDEIFWAFHQILFGEKKHIKEWRALSEAMVPELFDVRAPCVRAWAKRHVNNSSTKWPKVILTHHLTNNKINCSLGSLRPLS